jgi:hypothetical protein
MTVKRSTKLLREGEYLAEVDVKLIFSDDSWSPYLSIEDASKLDEVREALLRGDMEAAARLARIFALKPVAV